MPIEKKKCACGSGGGQAEGDAWFSVCHSQTCGGAECTVVGQLGQEEEWVLDRRWQRSDTGSAGQVSGC